MICPSDSCKTGFERFESVLRCGIVAVDLRLVGTPMLAIFDQNGRRLSEKRETSKTVTNSSEIEFQSGRTA